jgi:tetratricopeptide (TPR) repeat protein
MIAATLTLLLLSGVLFQATNSPKERYPILAAFQETVSTCDAVTDYAELVRSSIIAGDYETASTAANCTLEADPENLAAYLWQGGLAAANGDYDTLANNLHFVTSHHAAGSTPANTAIVQEIRNLSSAVQARPDDFVPYLLRGLFYWAGLLDSSARTDWNRVMELAPDNQVAYLFGSVLEPDPEIFTQRWTVGLNLAPDSTLIDWVAGYYIFFVDTALSDQTREHFDQTIDNNPSHPFAYLFRGYTDISQEDMETAAQDFYQHIQINQTGMIDGGALAAGDKVTLENALPGEVYQLSFTAEQGQVLTLGVTRDNMDSLLVNAVVVLNAEGEVIEVPYSIQFTFSVAPEVGFRQFEVPETGTYTLLVLENDRAAITLRLTEPKN